MLKPTPSQVADRGGGRMTYNNEVIQNHTTVGIKVYAQANAKLLNRPFPRTNLPSAHNPKTEAIYPIPLVTPSQTNLRVSKNGCSDDVFTNEAKEK